MQGLVRCLAALLSLGLLLAQPGVSRAQSADQMNELLKALESVEGAEFLEDPDGILAWVDVPRELKRGETAELRLDILNTRDEQAFRMSTVDIYDGFLDGFEIVSIEPEPRATDHSMGFLTLEYPLEIEPGKSWSLRVSVRAEVHGSFVGDVDVYEGERFLTRKAQALIR